MKKKVSVVSLGCDKNRVDTERMLFNLSAGGYEIVEDFSAAQIIIINTCAFIESARNEAIQTIIGAGNYKSGQCEKLIVTGCLPQKYSSELVDGLPEVDAYLGTSDYEKICAVIEGLYLKQYENKAESLYSAQGEKNIAADENAKIIKPIVLTCADFEDASKRILSTPAHYAYLKIADGCDNHCTFCTIPSIRGKYRSRTINSLINEAKGLADSGVKEIILVAQDVTRYGFDLYNKLALIDLIKELSKLDFTWIRLMYCYPELVSDELIAEIDNNPKLAKYIDIPLQHADSKILKLMNRRSSKENLIQLMQRLSRAKNHIALRTTVMVCFPSEGEDEFNTLYNFIDEYKPQHVGVFAYSKEEDTPSAKIKGHLPLKIKKERVKKIGELHLKNCVERNSLLIGKTLRVLYEDIDYKRNLFKGRTEFSAPEIDTFVYFTADFADVGCFYDVTITGYDNYDLIGEIKKQ